MAVTSRSRCGAAVLAASVALLLVHAAAAAPLAPVPLTPPIGAPAEVHLSYSGTPSSMRVTYATTSSDGQHSAAPGAAPTGTVKFGTTSGGPYTGTATATASTYSTSGTPWPGTLYKAEMTGLTPATKYYYTVAAGSQTSQEFSFTTAPTAATYPTNVAVFADMGEECSTPGCPDPTIKALNAAAGTGEFDLVVHAGDIAYTSGTQSIWDAFLNEVQPTAATLPYMTCPGNHEHWFNFTGYKSRFFMPGPNGEDSNLWNSFDWGPIHFLAFSTEHPFYNGTAQNAWMEADLKAANANRENVPWIFMYGHRPFYCSTDDYYDCEIFAKDKLGPNVEWMLKKYNVDVYVAGHLHNYERAFVTYNGTVTSKTYSNMQPGQYLHAVAGMAGDNEGLTDKWMSPTPDWSAVRVAKLGYVKMAVESASQMTWTLLSSEDGSTLDSVTMVKQR